MAQTQVDIVGPQDVDLSVSPTRSFFQRKFKRHTPFAIEPKVVDFQRVPQFGQSCSAVIPKAGDLLVRLYLNITLPALTTGYYYTNDVGRSMIDSVSLRMGSIIIDTLYPEYLHAWEEISVPTDRHANQATGKSEDVAGRTNWAKHDQQLTVPLEFYFQRDMSCALPLLALHTTPVDIIVNLKHQKDLIQGGVLTSDYIEQIKLIDMKLMGEFAYLDSKEREVFLNKKHQYIITQLQRQPVVIPTGIKNFTVPLTFSNPVKELIIVTVKEEDITSNKWFKFGGYEQDGNLSFESFETLGIDMNSCVRVNPLGPVYYRIIQTSEYHTRIPHKVIYVYSFSVHPEDSEPSGSLNMSRIDNVSLKFQFSDVQRGGNLHMYIFAKSINVLKVFSGVASLKWSA